MNFLRFCLIVPIVASTFVPLTTYAQSVEVDPIVVTASRFEQQLNQIGSDVTIITAEEIKEKQITSLEDALRYVPGLRVAQTGNGSASFFARGSKSDSVLVMIDGVPITDSTSLSFDASQLYLANAEKIEVVLGAQSALYGANALSGVINIITKQGEGDANGSILVGLGAPTQALLQANVNGGNENSSWAIGLNGQRTNLFSTTNSKTSDYNSDFDESNEVGFNSNLSLYLSDTFTLSTSAYVDYQNLEYDSNPMWATLGDDIHSQVTRTFFNVNPELILLDGAWNQSLNLALTNHDRSYISSAFPYNLKSYTAFADWQNKFSFGLHNIALGLEYQHDKHVTNDTIRRTHSAYGEYSINPFDTLYVTLAGRIDTSETYDNIEPSGSLALAYTISASDTMLHASGGRSFKAPTLSQYGDTPSIEPEHAYIFDIGVKQPLFDNKLELALMYYNASYRDMISYAGQRANGTLIYENVEKMDAQGIEFGIYAQPIDALTASFVGTWQDTKDHSTDKRQIRQAEIELALHVDYLLPIEAKDIYVGASVTYVGERDDQPYGAPRVTLDDYTLFDLRTKAYIQDNLSLTLKVNNILNEEYEELYGYNTLGINGLLTLEYTF